MSFDPPLDPPVPPPVGPTSQDVLPTGPPPPRGKGRLFVVVGVLVALALVAAGAVVLLGGDDDDTVEAEAWDERLVELVEFVEDERGLDFDHPVPVEFLDDAAFEELVTDDEAELSEEEREEIETSEALFRALGLLASDVDLLEANNEISGSGTLALYDPEDKHMRIRGTEMTPAIRSTVVHELTHALQDQHFDLGRFEELAEGDDSAASVLRALAEGDAQRIESAYEAELSDAERAQIAASDQDDAQGFDIESFPPVLVALFSYPYALGEPLVGVLLADGGQEAVDDALAEPFPSDEVLLDPLHALTGDETEDVEPPELPDGTEEIDSGEFSAFGTYLVLAQRLEERRAFALATRWGGDHYVSYRDGDDRVCVQLVVRGETDDDTADLAVAFGEWLAPMPAGLGSVEQVTGSEGEQVIVRSCDGGDAVTTRQTSVDRFLAPPAIRSQLVLSVVEAGGSVDAARCFGDGVLAAFTVDELVSDEVSDEAQKRILRIATDCAD